MNRFPVLSGGLFLLLLLPAAACAPCRSVPATGVTRETPFSRGTMKEAEEYDASHPRTDNTVRVVPFHEMPPPTLPEK